MPFRGQKLCQIITTHPVSILILGYTYTFLLLNIYKHINTFPSSHKYIYKYTRIFVHSAIHVPVHVHILIHIPIHKNIIAEKFNVIILDLLVYFGFSKVLPSDVRSRIFSVTKYLK